MVASTSQIARSIVIFGATGAQGGSVLTHLLKSDRPYRIRAVTRDPTKASSKGIADQGVQVVQGELGEKKQVLDALKGNELAFAVTNFWEHGAEKGIADGKRLMDAAKEADIKTLYWSGLEPVSKISAGKYTEVKHFDTKAEILAYARSIGVPIVDVQPAMYMENFITQMGPRKKMDLINAFPMAVDRKLSLLHAAADYGAYVRGAIESNVPVGGEVLACGDELTPVELAERWGQVTNKKTSFYPIDGPTFAGLAGEEITQMVQYFSDFGYYGGKEVESSKEVLPSDESVQTWSKFVKTSDWSKVLA